MSKKVKRWAIWQIVAAIVGCAVAAPALFWVSTLLDVDTGEQPADPLAPAPIMTISSLVTMLAMFATLLGILAIVWLVVRIRNDRIPAWEKQARKSRF